MRKTRRRGNPVSRQEHFWTSVVEDQTQVLSAILRFTPIVGPTDWVVRAGYAAGTTLHRIRGHCSVILNNAGAGGAAVSYAIIVADADDAAGFNPNSMTSLNEYRVLWTRTKQFFTSTDLGGSSTWNHNEDNFEVDVKVKAKLRPDDYVYMVTFCNATAIGADEDVRLLYLLRGLLVVK